MNKEKIALELSQEIYRDVAKKSAQQIGSTLEGITKIALSPLNGLIWGFETIMENFVYKRVSKKLEGIDQSKIVTPDPLIAGPILESMRFLSQHEELQDLYAQLLANAMNTDRKAYVLPLFVDMIKQLSELDIKTLDTISKQKQSQIMVVDIRAKIENQTGTVDIYRNFTVLSRKDTNPEDFTISIENLERLKLVEIVERYLTNKDAYKIFEQTDTYKGISSNYSTAPYNGIELNKKLCYITNLGLRFLNMVQKS